MAMDYPSWFETTLPQLKALILTAGEAVMEVYQTNFSVTMKQDHSPVTKADGIAEAIIGEGLIKLAPAWPIVAEEACSQSGAPQINSPVFWLVDPLDGTREFMARNGQFTVNIGLIHEGKTCAGLIYAPAMNQLYWGSLGNGAWRMDTNQSQVPPKQIFTRTPPKEGIVVVASARHGKSLEEMGILPNTKVIDRISIGSSLKFCLLAEGKGDLYPRLGRTMEWDTAAGHAILQAAGGRVETLDGKPFAYKKQADFSNPSFLAWGNSDIEK